MTRDNTPKPIDSLRNEDAELGAVYSSGASSGLLLDRDLLGRPRPWVVENRGLEYSGEVILAETVDPRWGEPLSGGLCFRVVFYTVPRRIPAGQIKDPRIAVAVPRAADPDRESLGHELQSIREAQSRYLVGHDPSSALRGSLGERERSILEDFSRRQAVFYSEGRVYTHAGVRAAPSGVFEGARSELWVDRVVNVLFRDAFPTLPFDSGRLPATLTTDLIEQTVRGIVQGESATSETAARFALALGLASPQSPALFDPGSCPAIELIKNEIEARNGQMEAQDLLEWLCREHGLNRELATLYLLAYVVGSNGEIVLQTDHLLRFKPDTLFPGDRLSWDLVPDLAFDSSISDQFAGVSAKTSDDWNLTLPYASHFVDGLSPSDDPDEISSHEKLLLDELAARKLRLREAKKAIHGLAKKLESDLGDAAAGLDGLIELCDVESFQAFRKLAVAMYSRPSRLRDVLEQYQRIETLTGAAPVIETVRAYLLGMTFGSEHGELATERDVTLAQLGFDDLMSAPTKWDALVDRFDTLKGQYAKAYRSHHADYHRAGFALLAELDRRRAHIDALRRFVDVPEFGDPVGRAVPERFEAVSATVRRCSLSEDDVSIESAPTCSECRLRLSEDLPDREAASVLADAEVAMREYNRRFSSEGVRRILSHPTKEQLDKFIDLAQVSDLSGLSSVLDDEALDFLRDFIQAR